MAIALLVAHALATSVHKRVSLARNLLAQVWESHLASARSDMVVAHGKPLWACRMAVLGDGVMASSVGHTPVHLQCLTSGTCPGELAGALLSTLPKLKALHIIIPEPG